MATRRQFLVSTIAASALSNCAFGAARSAPGGLKIVSEALNEDAASFSRHCNAAADTIDHDPASLLFGLEADLAIGSVDTIVGLTRPSTRFLIEQCAARYGCVLTYHGDHRYGPDGLVHELRVAPDPGSLLERRLLREPPQWARTLAQSFDLMGHPGAPAGMIRLVTAAAPGELSMRHLVSWMLRRYG